MMLHLPGEGQVRFERFGGGEGCVHLSFLSETWDRLAATQDTGEWFGSVMAWHGSRPRSNSFATITRPDGMVFRFDRDGSLERITDRLGATTTIVPRPRANGAPPVAAAVVGPTGRWLRFAYASDCDTSTDACRVTSIADSAGRSVSYSYDSAKRLTGFVDVAGREWRYRYDDPAFADKRTAVVAHPEGTVVLENRYDAAGRVDRQRTPGQNPAALPTWGFTYTTDGAGKIVATEMTTPAGVRQRVEMNGDGFVVADHRNHGTPQVQTTSYVRAPGTGLVSEVSQTDSTYPAGRKTTIASNPDGVTWSPTASAPADDRLVSSTTVATTTGPLTESWTYLPWVYGQPRSHTAPGVGAETFTYDTKGRLTGHVDPDGHSTTITPGPLGLPVALDGQAGTGHTEATWSHGQLVTATNAAGEPIRLGYDAAGRSIVRRSPAGNRHTVRYNPDNTVATETDGNGASTTYQWGRWGLESMTAPGTGGTVSFHYGPFLAPDTRTDPFGKTETWAYRDDGRLAAHTSRAGHRTEWAYQTGTGRLTQTRFGVSGPTAESTQTYAYDTAGRLTTITDTTSGPLTFAYDDLDRPRTETTPTSTLTYGWDPATARLASVTPGTQPATTYTFTPAGRPKTVTRAGETSTYLYDTAGRGTGISFPDGSANRFELDNAGRVTRAIVDAAAGADRQLTYGYGPDGHVETLTGDNPYLVTPALTTGTHDRFRLTGRDAKTVTYDDDGNTTSTGSENLTWDARGQLSAVTTPTGGAVATYTYDALGRRTARTTPQGTTTYTYRGQTPITERNGSGTITADYTLGAGLDQRLRQHGTAGTASHHHDTIGSALALTDPAGQVATTFKYTPDGHSSQTTAAPTSPTTDYRHGGQPTDPNGLTYLRARYYQPASHRFLSEDPAGIAAGPNPYEYLSGNPLEATDPLGTSPFVAACAIGAISGAVLEFLSSNKTSFSDLGRSAAIGCLASIASLGASRILQRALTPSTAGVVDDVVGPSARYNRVLTTAARNEQPGRSSAEGRCRADGLPVVWPAADQRDDHGAGPRAQPIAARARLQRRLCDDRRERRTYARSADAFDGTLPTCQRSQGGSLSQLTRGTRALGVVMVDAEEVATRSVVTWRASGLTTHKRSSPGRWVRSRSGCRVSGCGESLR